jgi:predicted Zn-dependent protease DUF2268
MRIRRTIAMLIALPLLLVWTPIAPAASQADFVTERGAVERLLNDHKVINIVDDFLSFWDVAADKNSNVQRRLWMRMVEDKHRDYFERAVYRGADLQQRRLMLDQFLLRVPGEVDAIRELNKTIYAAFIEAVVHFKEIRFREYHQNTDVFIGLSLFRFDGAVRPVQNNEGIPDTLCLGAEVLSRYSPGQLRTTIIHELFHLYHFNFLFAEPRQWSPSELRTPHIPLMVEGMAVAGSEEAFPSQTRSVYLHYSDRELASHQQALAASAARFLEMIQAGAPVDEYEQWFAGGGSDELVSRGGYLLGYEVTRRLRASYTFEQLVRMSPAELREHSEEQLAAMAGYRVLLFSGTN